MEHEQRGYAGKRSEKRKERVRSWVRGRVGYREGERNGMWGKECPGGSPLGARSTQLKGSDFP